MSDLQFEKHYYSLNEYMYKQFGGKVYKLALNSSCTCPNRDGKAGTGGCIFCSNGGSGDFAPPANWDFDKQINWAKENLSSKLKNNKDVKYMAYFQSFSNTYGDLDFLEKLYKKALSYDDIVAISIATRPDCIDKKVVEMLKRLNEIKPVWLEMGLQTIHEKSAEFIRRGYSLDVYDNALGMLADTNVEIITHLILGLPGEDKEMMLQSVKYVCKQAISGIKLHMLHVLKDTDLAKYYHENRFKIISLEEYCSLLGDALSIIPKDIVIHRLTGDGPKKLLIEPLWSADKKNVLNTIHKYFKDNNIYQGSLIN
ncbi:MAG: TIGR01212 family radical SAM protein [Lachnospiraceae bacterium]|nr:TIGR01212 family radical SAM protein [Lachnospiraceae bacterium]